MSDPTACPAGVPAEDVAAFVLDAEPSDVIDLASHVPTCAACTDVVRSLPGAGVLEDWAGALRAVVAPPAVADRALRRIRAERRVVALASTLAGGWLRVARAALDRSPPSGHREDRDVSGGR
jgi:hypothetical protein